MILENLNNFSKEIRNNFPIMGIDYGKKKIGISISDLSQCVASSHKVLLRTKFKLVSTSIRNLVTSERICGIVLGLPLNMNGSEGPRCQATREFGRNLVEAIQIPLVFWDERLSTSAAERTLIEADLSRKKRSQVIDMVASTIILQGALDGLKNIKNKKLPEYNRGKKYT